MNSYNSITKNLPPLYKTENTLKRYKVLSKFFDDEFNSINLLNSGYNIEIAEEEKLSVIGNNLKIFKRDGQDLETYRSLVKIANYNCNFIPLKNNILKVAEKVTGFFPVIVPLWSYGDEFKNDLGYYLAYDTDLSYPTEVLDNIETLIAAGIKIKRDYFFKVQGVTIYPCIYYNDNDNLNLECTIPIETNFIINQELILSNALLDFKTINIRG